MVADFDTGDSGFEAIVKLNNQDVYLTLTRLAELSDSTVYLFVSIMNTWVDNGDEFAALTEDFVRRFLPGRKVSASALRLWNVELEVEENEFRGVLRYRLSGDYNDPTYKLEQFDGKSVLEFDFDLQDGQIDWSSQHLSSTNDFD